MNLFYQHTPSPVTYLGVMVDAGTRDEQPAENGMAHFIEHCVFKGTERHTARQIIQGIESFGGEINAYTTKEETTYYIAIPVEHTARALSLLSEMLTCPSFPKEDTDRERQVIYDEIEVYNDSPSELIYDDFEALIFQGHPLAQSILGSKKTLRCFTAEKARAFMRRTYLPERMVLFVETSESESSFRRKLAKHFPLFIAEAQYRGANIGEAQHRLPPAPDGEGGLGKGVLYRRRTHQHHEMLGGLAYPLGHENQLGLYLLNNILGGGAMNSLLNMRLREQHGLCYTVDACYTPLSDTGYWSVYFACDPENAEQCRTLVLNTLRELREKPLSETHIRRALRQLHGQMAIADENRENRLLAQAKSVLRRGYAPGWEEVFRQISQFTPAQLQQIAQEVFSENNIFQLQYC